MIVVWTVAILALIPGLAVGPGVIVAPDGPTPGLRLAMSATAERIPLPRTRAPLVVTVQALDRKIHLRVAKGDNVKTVAAQIIKHVGMLCPRVEVEAGDILLHCRSSRIEAQLSSEGKVSYLDINELRGLPWRGSSDAPPGYHYDPWRIGLGQSCPGRTEAAQGECELKHDDALAAAMHFRKALETLNRQMACVRLGDLAMGIGDPLTAGGWYRRAGSFGVFGRVADGRLCELDGKCLAATSDVLRTFDASGMPEPLRAETTMRAARAEAYMGRMPSAAHIIARQVRDHGAASICREGGETLCRRILLAAMKGAAVSFPVAGLPVALHGKAGPNVTGPAAPPLDKETHDYLEELVETYLAIPSWEKGPLAVEMAQAAAPLAARLGAPAFGGNLLASLAPEVPDAQLSGHLLLAAETFLIGQNWARARVVTEYAQTRLGAKNMKSARWVTVLGVLSGRAEENEVSPAVRAAIEAEFAATLVDLKNARLVMAKADSIAGGARDASRGAAAKPGEAKTGSTKPGQAKAVEAKPGDAKAPQGAARPKPGGAHPDGASSGAIKPGMAKPTGADRGHGAPQSSKVPAAGAVTADNSEAKR